MQRAASRLYCAGEMTPNLRGAGRIVGPEFVVKATLPPVSVILGAEKSTTVTVILLDGQRVEVSCDVDKTTAGQLFETVVQHEHLEDNFVLGLSALIAGDFVFLPSDIRLSKVFSTSNDSNRSLLLFVRVRFFLPKEADRSSHAQHALYLQVRRSLLEHQLPCPFRKIIELAGLALQAEFGDFNEKEYGSRKYFLIEHYVPETVPCVTKNTDRLRREIIDAHSSRKGLSREKSEEIFVSLAQTLPHYGNHFYTATWVMKDNSTNDHSIRKPEQKPVWLRVSAQGVGLYERGASTTISPGGPVAYIQLEWRSIRTLCYSKCYLCILPHRDGEEAEQKQLKKYKLRMEHNKSYFAFRLASLHHQFFLRLRTEYDCLPSLSRQFGVPLKSKDDANSLQRLQNVYQGCQENVTDGTEFDIEFRPFPRTDALKTAFWISESIEDCKRLNEGIDEVTQNKKNETHNEDKSSSCHSTKSKGALESHIGMKMGVCTMWGGKDTEFGVLCATRTANAVTGNTEMLMEKNGEPLLQLSRREDEAFVLACSMMTSSYSESNNIIPLYPFELKADETLGESLTARLQNASFIEGERRFMAVRLHRGCEDRGLGIRIAAGEDGGIYIVAVMLQQDSMLDIGPGDQVVAVNGTSLLGVPYERAARILQEACGDEVELVIATERPSATFFQDSRSEGDGNNSGSRHSVEEKHATKSCRDIDNAKKHPTTPPLSVPYQKHTQHEIETDIYCTKAIACMEQQMTDMNIETTSHHHMMSPPLLKIFSNSCSNFTLGKEDNMAMMIDMTNEQHAENDAGLLDNKRREALTKVAVPRSLGTGRKWRGPVRYPVTPVRTTIAEAECPTTIESRVHFHEGLCDDSPIHSDEEQVFI